jgi:DNA-binding NarL/FixJ family response regulator
MPAFIVHAKGFVRETTAELLRARGVPVVEAEDAEEVVRVLSADPEAVLVCNEVPTTGPWTRDRRVILLDGVDHDGILRLIRGGALVARPARGTVASLLDTAFAPSPEAADRSVVTGSALRVAAERESERPVLTRRQIEVVRLIGRGLTSNEIADHLGVRPKTVENYKQRVFVRLGVQNQAHAVARCARLGLMDDALVLAS